MALEITDLLPALPPSLPCCSFLQPERGRFDLVARILRSCNQHVDSTGLPDHLHFPQPDLPVKRVHGDGELVRRLQNRVFALEGDSNNRYILPLTSHATCQPVQRVAQACPLTNRSPNILQSCPILSFCNSQLAGRAKTLISGSISNPCRNHPVTERVPAIGPQF